MSGWIMSGEWEWNRYFYKGRTESEYGCLNRLFHRKRPYSESKRMISRKNNRKSQMKGLMHWESFARIDRYSNENLCPFIVRLLKIYF